MKPPATKGNRKRDMLGHRGRQDLGTADTPFNTSHVAKHQGKQEGVQRETKGDKTLGKADTSSNTNADTFRKQ